MTKTNISALELWRRMKTRTANNPSKDCPVVVRNWKNSPSKQWSGNNKLINNHKLIVSRG